MVGDNLQKSKQTWESVLAALFERPLGDIIEQHFHGHIKHCKAIQLQIQHYDMAKGKRLRIGIKHEDANYELFMSVCEGALIDAQRKSNRKDMTAGLIGSNRGNCKKVSECDYSHEKPRGNIPPRERPFTPSGGAPKCGSTPRRGSTPKIDGCKGGRLSSRGNSRGWSFARRSPSPSGKGDGKGRKSQRTPNKITGGRRILCYFHPKGGCVHGDKRKYVAEAPRELEVILKALKATMEARVRRDRRAEAEVEVNSTMPP